ncbi:MAG: phage major capsid protein [Bacilli bacterium]|nr:phage major capsid protein [Bacilli bacterium]
MTKEQIEARKLEIREEVEKTEDIEKVEELNKEVETLNEEERKIEEHIENEKAAKEMEEKSFAVKEVVKEEKEMENNKELRNSKEYIDAFANYIKTNDDKELRALVTTGGYATGNSATVEVPDMVYDIVKTAWEREELMSRVRSLSVKGNLKVQFEVSGDPAIIHQEGNGAVTEQELVLGVVTLVPMSIKKWISLSDEVIDMRSEDFLRYIYDEITYRIAKKCADILVAKIAALPQSLTANSDGVYDTVSANKITAAPSISLTAQATGNLSDEANNLTIVMNKLTYAKFKEIQYTNNYALDIFEGIKVVFNNSLPAYDTASSGDVYMIVGDFNHGALANYPSGEGIEMKYDDKTKMEYDLVRILGRKFVGVEAVADKAFCLIAKPVSA